MNEKLRVLGELLDDDRLYVDCVVTSITIDGTVTLQEQSGTQTWTMDMESMQSHIESDNVAKIEELDTTGTDIWDDLDTVYQKRDQMPSESNANQVAMGARQAIRSLLSTGTDDTSEDAGNAGGAGGAGGPP